MKKILLQYFLLKTILFAQDILETENLRYEAMISADTSVLIQLLHDSLIYNHSNGISETKTDFINSVTTGKIKYGEIRIESRKILNYGNFCILSGVINMKVVFNDQDLYITSRYSAVYVLNDRWKLILWQSTRIN